MEANYSIVQALTKQAQQADLLQLSTQVRRGLEDVSHITAINSTEAADILADAIAAKLKGQNIKLQVLPFTYQDSKMAGVFSSTLLASIKQKISDKGISIIETSNNEGKVFADALLTGVYWVENNQLRIIGTVKGKDGAILAGAEALLAKEWFTTNNITWLPEKFEEAGTRLKIFKEGEIIGGGLNLDLWTNKGNESLLYHENDTLKLYVRCNHECYLRFIYYMADGSKVLLMNDYYINSEQINKVVQIPETFVCAAPFGCESLVLNGQTSAFPNLETKTIDGYTFITNEQKAIVTQTRGFKPANNQMLNGEKRLIINTVKFKF